MFIHCGSYSVLGRHEWSMENEAIPVAEYQGSAGDAPRPPDGTAPSADRFTDDDHRP
jgi:hypothetical protein